MKSRYIVKAEMVKINLLSRSNEILIVKGNIVNFEMGKNTLLSTRWENICTNAIGDITAYLTIHNKYAYREWNNVATWMKENLASTLQSQMSSLISEGRLEKSMEPIILYNLLAAYLYYSDIVESQFFADMYSIYTAGKIPCGWRGKYPDGNLYIYSEVQ